MTLIEIPPFTKNLKRSKSPHNFIFNNENYKMDPIQI